MISTKKRYHSKKLSLIAHREIKSARNTPAGNPEATGAVIIKLFYDETQRGGCHLLIIAKNISRISLNFDFRTKKIKTVVIVKKWRLK
jgi:hypothetical protein